MEVQVIKATRTRQSKMESVKDHSPLIRVAAYCRVSTDSEEQESSYEAQCQHFTNLIAENPDWILADIYADEGITGTSRKKRDQFNRMMKDCEDGKIDMVITKSISRWARNTIDSLQSIRALKDLGIPVLFEKENINTMDTRGEVLITIMSSIAQQESDSISRNVRMGLQYQMQQGVGHMNTSWFLGYTRERKDGPLVIIPEEAELVRRIYRDFLNGFSPYIIAAHLEKEDIRTPSGRKNWYHSTVSNILKNEKYCGDLLMQKYYVEDFLTHRLVKNNGQLPQYYVENAHEPIVPKEVFYQVQGEIVRRSAIRNEPSKLRFGSDNALHGRLICGKCGRTLKRYTNPHPNLNDWRCRTRAYDKKRTDNIHHGECSCRNVLESEVKTAIVGAINQVPGKRDNLIRMQGALRDGVMKQIDESLKALAKQKDRMETRLEFLNQAKSDNGEDEFLRQELEELEDTHMDLVFKRAEAANTELHIRQLLELIDAMNARKVSALTTGKMTAGMQAEEKPAKPENPAEGENASDPAPEASPACHDYEDFFRRTSVKLDPELFGERGKIRTFSDTLVIRYLESVTVREDGYDILFKCGLKLPVTLGGKKT